MAEICSQSFENKICACAHTHTLIYIICTYITCGTRQDELLATPDHDQDTEAEMACPSHGRPRCQHQEVCPRKRCRNCCPSMCLESPPCCQPRSPHQALVVSAKDAGAKKEWRIPWPASTGDFLESKSSRGWSPRRAVILPRASGACHPKTQSQQRLAWEHPPGAMPHGQAKEDKLAAPAPFQCQERLGYLQASAQGHQLEVVQDRKAQEPVQKRVLHHHHRHHYSDCHQVRRFLASLHHSAAQELGGRHPPHHDHCSNPLPQHPSDFAPMDEDHLLSQHDSQNDWSRKQEVQTLPLHMRWPMEKVGTMAGSHRCWSQVGKQHLAALDLRYQKKAPPSVPHSKADASSYQQERMALLAKKAKSHHSAQAQLLALKWFGAHDFLGMLAAQQRRRKSSLGPDSATNRTVAWWRTFASTCPAAWSRTNPEQWACL